MFVAILLGFESLCCIIGGRGGGSGLGCLEGIVGEL